MSAPGRLLAAALRDAAWAPAAVFLLHLVASGVGAYGRIRWLDLPFHLAGGTAIAFLSTRVVLHARRLGFVGRSHAVAHGVGVMGLVALAAVGWEFAEFLFDRYLGTRAQAGLEDTLLDLAMGLAGGLAFVVATARRAVSEGGGEGDAGAD